MDNIGDWLYIVFLVIAGISSLFGSKDKKKTKSRPEILGQPDKDIVSDNQPSKDKGFWEILQEMQEPQEAPAPKPRPIKKKKQKVKAKQPKETVVKTNKPEPFLTNESLIPDSTPSPTYNPIKPIEDEPGLISEETFKDMEELRKAIICSEILTRKY